MRELTIHEVARMFNRSVDSIGKRSHCPIRKHKREDKTFKIFRTSEGSVLWKCFSCDKPDDAGDAVKLYSLLGGVDRKTAWLELKDQGFAVPGAKESDRPASSGSRPPIRKMAMSVEGRPLEPRSILAMPEERWDELSLQRLGAVERFARDRGLDAAAIRKLDVVDMGYDAVGFGYRDPATGKPCRVKARALDRKTFWIEPRASKGEDGVALSPLYMADKLEVAQGIQGVAVITEGEVDALTLRYMGIRNVVSLPDGSGSASKVDLKPIWFRSALVLSAVDSDDEGDRAHRDLYARCVAMQKQIARVRWQIGSGPLFKDANDALKSGWKREQFVACLQQSANELRGYEVSLASAC
jgi:hypothetical protein